MDHIMLSEAAITKLEDRLADGPDDDGHFPECPAGRYSWEICKCKKLARDLRDEARSEY